MKYFMIIYHKPSGQILYLKIWHHAEHALSQRFLAEKFLGYEFINLAQLEIVVLGGKNFHQIALTHTRYFNQYVACHNKTHPDSPKGISICPYCYKIVVRGLGEWWNRNMIDHILKFMVGM